MIYLSKKLILLSILFLMAFSFIFHIVSGDINALAGEDNIVIGNMDEYSDDFIVVDNVRYGFCTGIQFFTNSSVEPMKDLNAAVSKVKLYENKGCVKKIVVLMFAL